MMKKSHSEGLEPDEALNLLDSVSDTFCLAKWKQVTLNLHTGTNSSCCLTPPSHIDLKDVQKNALTFHNTKENLKDRKELLDGIKTKSCSFCWDQEEKSEKISSERVYKSASPWASNYIVDVLAAKAQKLINPSYLEVSFSNKCNLKCMYCNPQTSSSFYEEVKKFGPYSDSQNIGDLAEIEKRFNFSQSEEENPYVTEFLKWFPDLVESLKVIRFTGGEPLYSNGMYKCFEILEDKSHKDLTIELNSNLSTSITQISKLEKSLNKVTIFKRKRIVTSLDTWGNQSEYIRFGLNLEKFKVNFEYLLENMPELEFRITVTFNILSAFNFNSLLFYVLDLKRKYKTYDKILLSLYPLISPYHLSIKVLDEEASKYLNDSLAIMEKYKISEIEAYGFNDYEIDSFRKIIDFYKDSYPKKLKKTLQSDFFNFISDYDYRKGLSIKESFPEIVSFWNKCKEQNDSDVLSSIEAIEKSYSHAMKLFNYAQKETSQTKEINDILVEKISVIAISLSDEDVWKFVYLLKHSKNKIVANRIAKVLINCVDYKFWNEILEIFPDLLEFFISDKEFISKLENNLMNDCDLWSLRDFLEKIEVKDSQKFIINLKSSLLKRSVKRLKDGKEDWALFPILNFMSENTKKDLFRDLYKNLENIEFKHSKIIAGTFYELIIIFSNFLDDRFVDHIYDKMLLTTQSKDIDSLFYGGALLKMKLHSKYINEKVFDELVKDPSLVILVNLIDKSKIERAELEAFIISLLLKQVEAKNGANIKIVKKYLNSICKDHL